MLRALIVLAFLLTRSAALAQAPAADRASQDGDRLAACLAAQDLVETDGAVCIGAITLSCLKSMGEAGASSNGGQMSCYDREADGWRSVVVRATARLRAQASPSTTALLDQYVLQGEAWARTRCGFEGSNYEGGSFARVIRAHCARNLYADQALYLYWRAYQATVDGAAWPPGP